MSELLQNWLNNEVGLSTNVSNFEKDFASGYLFGEILHKFWQADSEQFQNKNSHQAKIANFKTLEPILRALGIKCNATLINAVMNGERGAALRLLYQLKMASERSERPILALQASSLETQASAGWPGASTKVRQARMEKLTRKFELEKHKQEIVAYEMDNIEQAHVDEQRQIHRFSLRERLRQNRAAKDEWEARGQELWQENMKVRMARESAEARFNEVVFKKQKEKDLQTRTLATSEVLQGTKDFETGLISLGLSRKLEARRIKDLAEEESSEDDDQEETGERLLAQTSKVNTAKELVEALQSKLPTSQELGYEAGLFMRKIKESKQAGAIARRERERRRRRVLVEQQREQEMLEENQLEQVLLEKLGRQSVEESAISYRSWRAKTFEEVVVRNRQARQQQYSAQKKADKEEALRRDQDLRDEMIETMREQEELELLRYRAIERGRHAKRREKLREEMEGILDLIMHMAFADMEQEQLTDKEEVDPTLWREWVSLFQENLPVRLVPSLEDCAEEPAPLTSLPEPTGLANLHPPGSTLNAAALRDFVQGLGQWEVPKTVLDEAQPAVVPFDHEVEVKAALEEVQEISFSSKLSSEMDLVDGVPVNYRFGMVIASMIERMYKEPPPKTPPVMPEVPLRLVLTGKPYAGKRSVARRLAEAYGLEVVNLDELVRECLDLCKDAEAEPSELQVVGQKLATLLDAGKAVPAELYVQMVVTKLRMLFPDDIPKEAEEAVEEGAATDKQSAEAAAAAEAEATEVPADTAEQPKEAAPEGDVAAAAGDEAGVADETAEGAIGGGGEIGEQGDAGDPLLTPRGWILLGFPDDAVRLALLERFLSGFVRPQAQPTPKAYELRKEAEIIAPRPPEEPVEAVRQPGGYDLHFRLDLSLNESVRRACGRRIDPTTNLEYHIEDQPPPNKKSVIYERLEPADSLEKSMGTLTQRIHLFDVSQEEVDEILGHFGPYPDLPRLVEIDASGSSDSTYEAVEEQVALLLEQKKAELARRKAEAEEAEAAQKAAEEAMKTAPDAPADGAEAAADAPADPAPADDAPESTDPPPEPPFEPVQIRDLPSHVEKIEDQVFNLLMQEWTELQDEFVAALHQLFNWHRCHLSDFRSGLYGMKQRFAEYLQRVDGKQSLVDDFVLSFNLFTEEYPDMRKQDATKAEFHLRADELHTRLVAEVENQRTANLEQLEVLQTSRWLESQTEVLASQVQHAVQLEVKRYHATCQLLSDFYYSAMHMGLPEEHAPPPTVDVFKAEEEEPVDDKKKKDKDKKKAKDEPQEPVVSPEEKAAARLCRWVEPVEEGSTGNWEFPFLSDLMDQAQKAVWKLDDFRPPALEASVPEEEEKEDPKAKAKAKGKAKAKAKAAKEEEAPPPPPQPAPPLFVDLQQALLAERVTFCHRLTTIRGWALRRLHQAASSTKATLGHLNDWVVLRRHKDLEAVSCLIDVVKEHVESEDFIKTKLSLENAHLHRRPNSLLRAPKPPVVPPPVEGLSPFRWTIEQLLGLMEAVSHACSGISSTCRMLPNYNLLGILLQLTSADGSDKRTVKVPSNWRSCGAAKLKALLGTFDHPYSSNCVDVVDFLLHMCLLHSPLGWPSLNTLLEVRKVLEAQKPQNASWPDFYVPTSVIEMLPLFEDPTGAEDSFARKFKPITSEAPGRFDRSKAQLRFVGQVLQRFRAPSWEREAWALEASWYDYRVRKVEETERLVEMLDDVRTTPSDTPRQQVDAMPALLGHEDTSAADPDDAVSTGGQSTWSSGRPEKPRPEEPVNAPDPPSDYVSVRQLMAYFCQGPTTEEGIARAFAVLAPSGAAATAIPVEAAHAAILSIGGRQLPTVCQGDSRPAFPALQKMCEELDNKCGGSARATGVVGKAEALELVKILSLGRRHRRAEVEKIFPKVK